jgi:hypothetical protein
MKFRDFWDVAPCSHVDLMMGAVRTSETSVNISVTTQRCIPEDSKLKKKKLVYRIVNFYECRHLYVNVCLYYCHCFKGWVSMIRVCGSTDN